MGIFKFGLKAGALNIVDIILRSVFLLFITLICIPIIVIGLITDIVEKVSKKRIHAIHRFIDAFLDYLDLYGSPIIAWIIEHTTTEKERMWHELTKAEKENE
jgi:ATP/ADP translocase